MDDVHIVQIFDPFKNLFQKINGIFFRHFSLVFEVAVKIIVTYLGDNVHIVGGLEDVVEFYDVFVAYFLHDFDLTV